MTTADRDLERHLLDRPDPERLRALSHDSPRLTLDVGGSIREQDESDWNFETGVEPAARGWDEYHLHRLMVSADLRAAHRFRVFVEFGSSLIAANERPSSPIDQHEAHSHQPFTELGFVDGIRAEDGGIRLGYQEIASGSGRLFSLRYGPSTRRSFDAARLTLALGQTTIDAFVFAEVRTRPDAFGDRPTDALLAWGVYTTTSDLGDVLDLAACYLGTDSERSVFDAVAAPETRHSVGLRLWSEAGPLDYNFEPTFSFGDVGHRDILAWTIASDTGVRLGSGARAPRLGVWASIIGCGHSDDRERLKRFASYTHFQAQPAVTDANGDDLDYLFVGLDRSF